MKQSRYEKSVKKGLCGKCYKREADEGFSTCGACREKARLARNKKRTQWRNDDRCISCGGERDSEKLTCKKCIQIIHIGKTPYRRYAHACVVCGADPADVHHIDKNRSNNDPNNLISLCKEHHRLVHRGLLDITEYIENRQAPTPNKAKRKGKYTNDT